MNTSVEPERPRWPIDHLLNQLVGQPVRVVAEAFAPPRADGTVRAQMIPTADLILPDNRTPAGRPVSFEGVLESHLRRIGVVEVTLGVPAASAGSAAGLTDDRGVAAIVLPGPAIVRLAFPFRVGRLAPDDRHAGQGCRWSGAQLEWAWATPGAARQPVELTPDFSRAGGQLLKPCQSC